jgi:hypothetical protein
MNAEPEKGHIQTRKIILTIDTLLDNYQILEDHLLKKDNIYRVNELYSATLLGNKHVQRIHSAIKFQTNFPNFV